MIVFIFILLLVLIWIWMGYKGWTWIPIGKNPKKGQIKVACVGDSITYGALIPNWFCYNFPHQLQKMAGKKYCVRNYGMSDRTGMDTGNHPYRKELRYKRSLRFQPDIVLLMFGTNDSKPVNWLGREEFHRQYKKLVESYLNLKSRPQVILLCPPEPYHTTGETGDRYSFDIRGSVIKEIGKEITAIAEELQIHSVDMYEFTENHEEWFLPDGIHPNAVGAEQMAGHLFKIIRAM